MDTTKENLNGSKNRLSDWEYQWAVAIVYAGCISTIPHSLGAVDPLFSPKDSYYAWLTLLIVALLSNLLFDPRGRDPYKSFQVRYPRFLKAIFKARFFGAFYDAVLGARLRDFYMALLTMPFIAAIHEISAYCGHPSNLLIEGLVMLAFLCVFGLCVRLCAKLGW
ncbi:membrane protein [Helicobacter pylori PZ5056]|uniref:Membrane protein n=1 Tax=Helicobacter pylori PZ5056 TaxID=1337393 RepID=T2T685_HELPX|nr:membrane protein [Helicobacter pylori PZ5056]